MYSAAVRGTQEHLVPAEEKEKTSAKAAGFEALPDRYDPFYWYSHTSRLNPLLWIQVKVYRFLYRSALILFLEFNNGIMRMSV